MKLLSKRALNFFIVLLLFSSANGELFAFQNLRTAKLVGRVTDQAGAAVPHANVEVDNVRGEAMATTESDENGNYEINGLAVDACRPTDRARTIPSCSISVSKYLVGQGKEAFHLDSTSTNTLNVKMWGFNTFITEAPDPSGIYIDAPKNPSSPTTEQNRQSVADSDKYYDHAAGLSLVPKSNEVQADDSAATPTKPSATSSRDRTTPSELVAALPDANERWALVIGINDYDDKDLSPVYGANDAKTIANDLISYAGVLPTHLYLLSDDQNSDHQPTSERIWFYLTLINDYVDKGGLLIVVFSGHGWDVNGKSYLMSKNTALNPNTDYLKHQSIPAADLTNILGHSKAAQVIVILDACRNQLATHKGPSGAVPMTPEFARALDLTKANLGKQAVATIYATSVGDFAYDYHDKKMGSFSWELHEALSGAAYDDKGRLTLGALVSYLQTNTPKLVQAGHPGRQQRPYAEIKGYLANEVVIAEK